MEQALVGTPPEPFPAASSVPRTLRARAVDSWRPTTERREGRWSAGSRFEQQIVRERVREGIRILRVQQVDFRQLSDALLECRATDEGPRADLPRSSDPKPEQPLLPDGATTARHLISLAGSRRRCSRWRQRPKLDNREADSDDSKPIRSSSNVNRYLISGIVFAILLGAGTATAFSPNRRTDNAVAGWNARTGQTIWTYRPEALTQAFVQAYRGRIAVHLEDPLGATIELDPATGNLLPQEPSPVGSALAESHWFSYSEAVLDNGWRLVPLSPGNDKTLVFKNRMGRQTWTLHTRGYPEAVRSHGDIVFWTEGYPGGDSAVHAHEAGRAKEKWRFDVAKHMGNSNVGALPAPELEVFGNELYVQALEHVFILDFEGSLVDDVDLVAMSGVPWERARSQPAFYGEGLSRASMVRDAETLIVAYERRVVAVDARSRKLLWHKDPGCFPSVPLPVLHDGVVFLTVGTSGGAAPAGAASSAVPTSSSGPPSHAPAPAPPNRGHCAVSHSALDGSTQTGVLFALALLLSRRLCISPRAARPSARAMAVPSSREHHE